MIWYDVLQIIPLWSKIYICFAQSLIVLSFKSHRAYFDVPMSKKWKIWLMWLLSYDFQSQTVTNQCEAGITVSWILISILKLEFVIKKMPSIWSALTKLLLKSNQRMFFVYGLFLQIFKSFHTAKMGLSRGKF